MLVFCAAEMQGRIFIYFTLNKISKSTFTWQMSDMVILPTMAGVSVLNDCKFGIGVKLVNVL